MIKITKELGELIGVFIGDGFTGKYDRARIIQFTGRPKDDADFYLKRIVSLIKRNFNVNPHIQVRGRGLRVTCYSKNMYEFLTKNLGLPSGEKSSIIKIPTVFLKKKHIIKAVIRGIFDTDGSIVWDKRKIYKKPYPRLCITTVSKELAKQLKSLLKNLGFRVCLREVKRRKEYYRKAFYIELYGFEQLRRWCKEIGFSNPKHIRRLKPR